MKANLETLGLLVPIGFFRVYHDNGYVESMQDYLQELSDRYLMTDMGPPPAEKLDANVSGVHQEFRTMFRTHHHIFYRDLGRQDYNIGIRAHEETEMLIAVGRLNYLVDNIMRKFGIVINFNEIQDKEAKSYVGSVFALLCNGMNPLEFQKGISNERYERAFQTARKFFPSEIKISDPFNFKEVEVVRKKSSGGV